jgi:glycosyltransferase involved in cell wall biosynthesis
VLIEAMACEVPVLGSDSGEIPNVVGEGGLIFPEGNAEELAKLIKRLLEDAEYRRELGRAGRQRVLDNYTQERVAQQTRDVYLDILNPGREKSPAAEASVQPS